MRALFEKLETSTLRRRIADRIQEAVLHGALKPGERLVERKLAAQFETSLTAVREALIELEAHGFVTKKPNAATYVTKLSLEAAEKIFTVRRVLEVFAVEEAARRVSAEQAQRLEKLYGRLLETARDEDRKLFIQADLAVHEMIWEIADNEYLEAALRRVVLPIFAFTSIRIVTGRSFDLLQDARSHRPVLDAIKSKDPKAAHKAFVAALDEWLSKTLAYVFGETEEAQPLLSPVSERPESKSCGIQTPGVRSRNKANPEPSLARLASTSYHHRE